MQNIFTTFNQLPRKGKEINQLLSAFNGEQIDFYVIIIIGIISNCSDSMNIEKVYYCTNTYIQLL